MQVGRILRCNPDGLLGKDASQGAVVFLGRTFSGGEVKCELRSHLESHNLMGVPHFPTSLNSPPEAPYHRCGGLIRDPSRPVYGFTFGLVDQLSRHSLFGFDC